MKKFKQFISGLLFATLLVGCAVVAQTAKDEAPEAVIRGFYSWYVHSLNRDRAPFSKERATLRRYVSARLIREIDRALRSPNGLDADYFLDAQDWDKEWEKNIEVSAVKIAGRKGSASVKLSGPEVGNRNLRINLVRERGAWKIDRVKHLE